MSIISTHSANAAADAVCSLLDGGYLRIYDGAPPSTANAAVLTQRLLAELRFGPRAYAPAENGKAVAMPIAKDWARASGEAKWFRAYRADGVTGVFDGRVAVSGADLNFTGTTIRAGDDVAVSRLDYTQPEAS